MSADIHGLTALGRLIRMLGAARFYRDGSGAGFVWRWWHPLAWVIAPLSFVASVAVAGFPDTWRYRHEIGIGMKPWFKERPEDLRWL